MPINHSKLRELFVVGCDMLPVQQAALLDEQCRDDPELRCELELLLREDRNVIGMFADGQLTSNLHFGLETVCAPQLPQKIGQYRIKRMLGSGGMGVVYLAQQENPQRDVALKVIGSGMMSRELIKRFEFEAAMLGRLQHPGIAQIHEAGTYDDNGCRRPYFAMEYVEGQSLNQYAKQEDPPSLTHRLQLFVQICDAVHHAHQRGVIHRDLKPANILVTRSGQPRILDFGVARATETDLQVSTMKTGAGQLVGTLPYMSPEQIAGHAQDVDTRSDVYSLGVVLYELLVGKAPYDLAEISVPNAIHKIRQESPVRVSSRNRSLRGDIETIVHKSLEKEKRLRYQSASELAADINRFLNNRTIEAKPASTWNIVCKFTRRNKGLVAAVATIWATLLTAGILVGHFAWQQSIALADAKSQAAIARQKHQQSEEHFDQARSAVVRLTELSRRLQGVAGTDEIREQALREVLAFHLKQVHENADPAAALEAADTRIRIAEIRGDLRNFEAALRDLERARKILFGHAADVPGEMRCQELIASSYFMSGRFQRELGQREPAVDSFLTAAAMYGDFWRNTGNATHQICRAGSLANASALQSVDQSRATELIDQAIRLYKDHADEDDSLVLVNRGLAFETKAILLVQTGQLAEAVPYFEKALEDLRRADSIGLSNPDDISYLARVLTGLGSVSNRIGVESEVWSPHSRQAIEILRNRWDARPDRPANADQFVRESWYWAVLHWFEGDKVFATQIYAEMIETLISLQERFSEYSDAPAGGRDIVAYRLCLLWATCPVEELRSGQAALELARKSAGQRPDEPVALAGLAVAEALYGDVVTAENLLEQKTHLDSIETTKQVLRLAIQHRTGPALSAEDIDELKLRRDDRAGNYGGFTRQLAETILQMIDSARP